MPDQDNPSPDTDESLAPRQSGATRRGRQSRRVTKTLRHQVKVMSAAGLGPDEIAKAVEMPTRTATRLFNHEIRTGRDQINGKIVNNLARLATRPTKEGLIAAIFWCKTRMGWSEVQRVIHGLDISNIQKFVTEVISILRRSLPQQCPHCQTNLNLTPGIATQLRTLSQRMLSDFQPRVETVPNPNIPTDITPRGEPQ